MAIGATASFSYAGLEASKTRPVEAWRDALDRALDSVTPDGGGS
jgi:hypothetical protein